MLKNTFAAILLFTFMNGEAQVREKISLDKEWLFSLGHAYDPQKDFNNGSGYFSYFAKAGYGDGAAAENFDDRAWRKLDLPHDWCVELPFDSTGGHSHGYKAIGRNFPENSIGWYRKKIFIPENDLGKKISIEFDGVHRNSIVWVNGFYLGNEHSGYSGFSYDISDYLNYGGENTIAVRVDATMEEGWYYEGAGIYRHVWLVKTDPLHVERYGTYITADLSERKAVITSRTSVVNESETEAVFDLEELFFDADGKMIASAKKSGLVISPGEKKELKSISEIDNPRLWSLEDPYLHKMKTVLRSGNEIVDTYETTFGIRSVKFDPDNGFFLNGKNIKIKGSNMHQDHAGVGTAIPDRLQEYRIKRLKEMGANAIRTSHNPPAPELLDACDRLGMLVLDENRLMGINEEHLNLLERLIKRDRNHPSVIIWSLGNEEWAIEGNEKGIRITETMQKFALSLDSSRAVTAACSGGWDNGSGSVVQVIGYNYIVHGNIDEHHKQFSWQPSVGTEETNTKQTRGIYETNAKIGHTAPTRCDEVGCTEYGWKFYAERPFLSGLFYWTGFDYRGESNPYNWPAVINQSGNIDLCGFPKDSYYYLKSWWDTVPMLHITPHWNWQGYEGEDIPVYIYSNCDEVELFLNEKSLGKKTMPVNGHLEWKVRYQPGKIKASGFKKGKLILTDQVQTTGAAEKINLSADRTTMNADGKDVVLITVNALDKNGLLMPVAMDEVMFTMEGPGKIIGVGNGNPSSHESERFFEKYEQVTIDSLKEFSVDHLTNRPEVAFRYDDSGWKPAFMSSRDDDWRVYKDTLLVVRGEFVLSDFSDITEINLLTKSILENQSVYLNGHLIASDVKRNSPGQSYKLDQSILKAGKNEIAFTGQRLRKRHQWDEPNTNPGLVQVIHPAGQWKRNLFNGYAQVIIQSDGKPGEIKLTGTSEGLNTVTLKITAQQEK